MFPTVSYSKSAHTMEMMAIKMGMMRGEEAKKGNCNSIYLGVNYLPGGLAFSLKYSEYSGL